MVLVSAPQIVPWQEVTPLPDLNSAVNPILATVDSLRAAWKETVGGAAEQEFAQARQRSLRRHAIETGIIERLYDVDWGVTEALVAEGLTREAAAREGGIDDDVLAVINSQFDALQFLAAAARDGQPLTVQFIRQLHQLITRHQETYEATDALGRRVHAPLNHGEWKRGPNHVVRGDGTQLQYTPPEQVQPQMEALLGLYADSEAAHPVVRAAWLHHRFIIIHPFEDGNGRVARALTLLALLQRDYAPLVVDREHRGDYLNALDRANDGDLGSLVHLFAQLEIVGLRSELERPAEDVPIEGGAVAVARAYAKRLTSLKETAIEERAEGGARLATEIHTRTVAMLRDLSRALEESFQEADPSAHSSVDSARPPDERATYWHAQLVGVARRIDFFTNLSQGSWWARLRLKVMGPELRYVVAVQKVGHGESGVLAVTAFGELLPPRGDEHEPREGSRQLLEPSTRDSVTLIYTDSPASRWPEVAELIERTLAASVAAFAKELG